MTYPTYHPLTVVNWNKLDVFTVKVLLIFVCKVYKMPNLKRSDVDRDEISSVVFRNIALKDVKFLEPVWFVIVVADNVNFHESR